MQDPREIFMFFVLIAFATIASAIVMLMSVSCAHNTSPQKCNGDEIRVHVCPKKGHGPCYLCDADVIHNP
jgi:hypothetical protein